MTTPRRQPNEERAAELVNELMFASARWTWKQVRITGAPQATPHSGPKGLLSWVRRDRWPLRRTPMTIKVKYRGGPECWYEVHARGETGYLTGTVALHDLMQAICKHT